jgi:hypothetical protein
LLALTLCLVAGWSSGGVQALECILFNFGVWVLGGRGKEALERVDGVIAVVVAMSLCFLDQRMKGRRR